MLIDGVLDRIINHRYSSFDSGIGTQIVEGKTSFAELEHHALNLGDIEQQSGKTEEIKATINQYILKTLT